MAIPGSMNLAARSGHMSIEAMKVLKISSSTLRKHQVCTILIGVILKCFSLIVISAQPYEPNKPIDTDSVHFLAENVQKLQGDV
jgi:hypothetical protein